MDVPRYLREIRSGEFSRAEAVIREVAPLPRVLGQVCFHPCEDECVRGEVSEPVAICALKRAAVEHAGEPVWKSRLEPRVATGRKVAIVGAGPAGLTAAWFLRLKGHAATLFDSEPRPGGWLRDGIPRFRLSPDALEADVGEIVGLGIELRMGIEVGKDITFEHVRADHDAVFLAVGARKAKQLSCEGVNLIGVESGLELLQACAAGEGMDDRRFRGETVVVIGGGNVALDVARTALRLGALQVHLYCLEDREDMPAYQWEVEEAENEGVLMHPGWGPARFTGQDKVEGADFRKCLSVFDHEGTFAPEFDEQTATSQSADRVLVAVGQQTALGFLDGVGEINLTGTGNIQTEPDSLRVSSEGVFAGGEVVSGPASVVEAIADGRRAAAEIDCYLGGDGDVHFPLLDETELGGELGKGERFFDLKRNPIPRLPVETARGSFALVENSYTLDDARSEAERCFRCDLRLLSCPVPPPPEPWLEFNKETAATLPDTEGVYQLLDENQIVYAIQGVDNLRATLLGLVETSTKARFFLFEEDPMYSKRESELIQDYLKEHGSMPPGEGEDELDDLF
jgi:NADPH-dependent glutamate synthase beta subunit-like oxidoreductase